MAQRHERTALAVLTGLPRFLPMLLVVPVMAGLAGTVAPALPGVAGLLDWPGLPRAITLSLTTGLGATGLALGLALLIAAAPHSRVHRLLAPLLAVPHAAAAIALAFLIAPSGWIARALSPWATGWREPPDLLIIGDSHGLALMLGLVAKELPFLLLMSLAALPQCDAARRLQLAATIGYGRVAGFWLTVVPALYPQLRLPVLAVMAYAMTNADMAQVLGPTTPPTLAVQITRWMVAPGFDRQSLGAAAALVQLGVVLVAMAGWLLAERLAGGLRRWAAGRGLRLRGLDPLVPVASGVVLGLAAVLLAGLAALAVWSVAGLWRFPAVLPASYSLAAWRWPGLSQATLTTLAIALPVMVAALALTLVALQSEYRTRTAPLPEVWLYLPLILPQVCFVPGIQRLFLELHANTGLAAVIAAHLIFALPYAWLALAAPFRAWDRRIATVAATLGASEARIFWRLRLPMLRAAVLTAGAVAFAVSVGQYLPTLMIGGGRVATLATEAVALSSGGDRRLTGAHALMQSLLPLAAFALVLRSRR